MTIFSNYSSQGRLNNPLGTIAVLNFLIAVEVTLEVNTLTSHTLWFRKWLNACKKYLYSGLLSFWSFVVFFSVFANSLVFFFHGY